MPMRPVSIRSLIFVCGLMLIVCHSSMAQDTVDYGRQIKPVLQARCYSCHGALKQEGGLRLDTVALATKGGDSGAAIKGADADGSLLLRRVSSMEESTRKVLPKWVSLNSSMSLR